MHMLTAKSVAMVAKELVLGVAAYKHTRGAMIEAATVTLGNLACPTSDDRT